MGARGAALRSATRALTRWPASPYAWIAVVQVTGNVNPRLLVRAAKRFGRGIT
jgi:hypothetical protein